MQHPSHEWDPFDATTDPATVGGNSTTEPEDDDPTSHTGDPVPDEGQQ